jgi:uncharacterized protein YoxC
MKYVAQVVLYISLIVLVWISIGAIKKTSNLLDTFDSFAIISEAMEKAIR